MKCFLEKIDEALELRRQEYPKRGYGWNLLNERIHEFFTYLLTKSLDFNSFSKFISKSLSFEQNPSFIVGSMKSGTSLIQQLLDGNSRFYVVPGDGHMYNQYLNRSFSQESDLRHVLKKWINILINPDGKPAFWTLGKDIEQYEDFSKCLGCFLGKFNHRLSSFISPVYSACSCLYGEPRDFLEKTPGEENFVREICKIFPNSKFIHMVRNPIRNMASLVKLGNYRGLNNFQSFINGVANIINAFKKIDYNKVIVGENYKVVVYEDLINNTNEVMRDISEFFEIDFGDYLCVPTKSGRSTESNTMFANRRVSGCISIENESSMRDVIKDILTNEQICQLEKVFDVDFVKKYNFKLDWS